MKKISENYDEVFTEVTQLRYMGKFEPALSLIETHLTSKDLKPETKIKYALLKASVLNTMGKYKGLNIFLDELVKEIIHLNLPVEYLKAKILKVSTLQQLNKREASLALIEGLDDYIVKHKELSLEIQKHVKSTLLYHKGNILWYTGEFDNALEHLTRSMNLVKKTDDQELLGMIYNRIGAVYGNKGMFDKCLKYLKKNLDIQLNLMNKREIATAYNNIGETYFQTGEYDMALECYENCFYIDEEIGNKTDIGISLANVGRAHSFRGNHEKALETLKKALILNEEANDDYTTSDSLHYLIQLLIEMKAPITEVNQYLRKLEELYKRSKNNIVRDYYLISKGLVLKSSEDLAKKIEAKSYFKRIVKDDSAMFDVANNAALNLIELLLIELKSTESPKVLVEIEDLTNRLLGIAEKQNLAPVLVQTFLLQSKLSLLQLEINKAKKLLDKAGELADAKDLRKLSLTVMKEQKTLYDKLDSWENVIDKKVSIRERVEMAQIEDTLLKMTSHRLELNDDVEFLTKEFDIDKLSLLVFRFGSKGAEFFRGVDLPKSENIERDLYFMSATFMTMVGQGNNYHTGLFGPLPVPIKGYSTIIYSLMMNDRNQTDKKLKGKTYALFCLLYPQRFSTMFYQRSIIEKTFKTNIIKLKDLNEVTELFLIDLREDMHRKIIEVFSPTSI